MNMGRLSPRHPRDLSKRAVEVLTILRDRNGKDGGEIVASGLDVWMGQQRTNLNVVKQLLECCFIKASNCGPNYGSDVYAITEAGVRWLQGELPYANSKGEYKETMFDILGERIQEE